MSSAFVWKNNMNALPPLGFKNEQNIKTDIFISDKKIELMRKIEISSIDKKDIFLEIGCLADCVKTHIEIMWACNKAY